MNLLHPGWTPPGGDNTSVRPPPHRPRPLSLLSFPGAGSIRPSLVGNTHPSCLRCLFRQEIPPAEAFPWEQGGPGCPSLLQGARWVPMDGWNPPRPPLPGGAGWEGHSLLVQGLIIEIDSPRCHASIPAGVRDGCLCAPGTRRARTDTCEPCPTARSTARGCGERPHAGEGDRVAAVPLGVGRGGEGVWVSPGCCVHRRVP